jgi:hypothetical protein
VLEGRSSDDWAVRFLLDDYYLSGLKSNERALRAALQEFVATVSEEAKTSPGWLQIIQTLNRLGAGPGG